MAEVLLPLMVAIATTFLVYLALAAALALERDWTLRKKAGPRP
jgi:hypothetical protein